MGEIIIGVTPPPRPPRYLKEGTDTIIISVICQKSLKEVWATPAQSRPLRKTEQNAILKWLK